MTVGYMGVPPEAGVEMSQHLQYVTLRNDRGKEMWDLVKHKMQEVPTSSSGDRAAVVTSTVMADDEVRQAKEMPMGSEKRTG